MASAGAVISCLSGIRYLPESWQYRCAFGAVVNLSLLLVNLLPVLPLDGGRILLAITARRIGLQRAAKWLGRAGVWAGAAMIALSLYLAVTYNIYNMTLALCGCYLVYTANVCCKELIAHWIHGIILKRSYIENRQMMPIKELAVSSKCTVRDFCRLMKPGAYYRVSVINASALDLMGTLEEAQIQKAVMGNAAMTFEEVLRLSNQAP